MPSRKRAGPTEFDDAEKQPAQHRARHAADAAEHRRAERFDARREAHEEIDLFEDEGVADAGDARHRAAEGEREDHDPVDVDPHHRGGVGVLRDRPHRRAHARALHD